MAYTERRISSGLCPSPAFCIFTHLHTCCRYDLYSDFLTLTSRKGQRFIEAYTAQVRPIYDGGTEQVSKNLDFTASLLSGCSVAVSPYPCAYLCPFVFLPASGSYVVK